MSGNHVDEGGMSAALGAENVHSGKKVCRRPPAGDTPFFRLGRGGAEKGILSEGSKPSEGGLGKRSAEEEGFWLLS